MKRKKIDRNAAMLAVASAPVATYGATPYETPRQKFDREEAEAEARRKEIQDRPVLQAQSEHSRLLRELIDADLLAGLDTESTFLAATAPSIGTGEQFNGIAPEAIRATIRKAFSEAEDQLTGTLTEKGRLHAQQLARVNRNVDFTQSVAWTQLFYLLGASGELTSEDFIPRLVIAERSVENFDSVLERTNGETREGQRTLRDAAMRDYQGEVFNTWYQAWIKSVETGLAWSPTTEDVRHITGYMQARELSPLSARSWDAARVACCKARLLSNNNALYDDEKLAILISSDDTDTRTFSGKQKLRQMEQQILGA